MSPNGKIAWLSVFPCHRHQMAERPPAFTVSIDPCHNGIRLHVQKCESKCSSLFHSLWPKDAIQHPWTVTSLVQVMAWCPTGNRINACSLSIGPVEEISKEFESKHNFLSRKYIWKCCLQNVSHFVQASIFEDAMNWADWASINLIHAQLWQMECSAIYSSNNLPKKFSPERNVQQFVLQMAFSNASGWKTILVLKFYWNLFL